MGCVTVQRQPLATLFRNWAGGFRVLPREFGCCRRFDSNISPSIHLCFSLQPRGETGHRAIRHGPRNRTKVNNSDIVDQDSSNKQTQILNATDAAHQRVWENLPNAAPEESVVEADHERISNIVPAAMGPTEASAYEQPMKSLRSPPDEKAIKYRIQFVSRRNGR